MRVAQFRVRVRSAGTSVVMSMRGIVCATGIDFRGIILLNGIFHAFSRT